MWDFSQIQAPAKYRKPRQRWAYGACGHAPPPLEPAEAPFNGIARLVPFGVVGPGVRAPLPGGNDGLDALLLQPGAEGVAVIGPVGDQAGQGRARPGFPQGLGLGAVVALAARQAQVQGTAAAIRPHVAGCRSHPGCDRGRDPSPGFGRARRAHVRAVQPHGGQILIRLPVGHQARPDAPVAPGGPAAGPSSTGRTRSATAARELPSVPSRAPLPRKGDKGLPCPRVYRDRYSEKNEGNALRHRSSARRSSGAILGAIRKERDSRFSRRS